MQLNKNLTSTIICINLPPNVNSKGLWVQFNDPQWWLNSSLPLLEFQLILFCFSLAITSHFLRRFRISKLSSQILIGLAFGCWWNQWEEGKTMVLNVESQDVLALLADFGYTLFLFLSAAKQDVTMTMRTGKHALLIGISAIVIPLVTGSFLKNMLYENTLLTKEQNKLLPMLIGFHGITSFPVVASLVKELHIVNSELGRLGLSSALVSDIIGGFTLIAIGQANRFNYNLADPTRAIAEFGALLLFLLLVIFVFRPIMLWIVKQTPQGMPVKSCYIEGVVFLALSSTILANFTGQASIIGPYILGLAIPDGAHLASTLVDRIECLVENVFMPILVITCALRADFSKISSSTFEPVFTKLNIILSFVIFAVKVLGSLLSSKYCKLPFKDALALSLIISSKGSVELVSYTITRDYGGIDNGLFGFCILWIFIIATLVPIAVRGLYDPSRKYAGYQNRDIMHLNSSSDELRLLVCIHRNVNISAIVQLLNLSCPTAENPIAVHIFHLIELPGRIAPIFISHRLQNGPLNNRSYSRQIIQSFDRFERENEGIVYVECFTAISPCTVMHDEVCTLALDKVASLIILPFHITWTLDGYIDEDDNKIRTLNYSVLERAPCSVGIFTDRGNLGLIGARTSSSRMRGTYSVCVIFLGGRMIGRHYHLRNVW
ncbi:cation/H(+) antiporter 3-like [Benincasa hispida]|uniref:cation/H(+) antiporter 3-like n=1 Tax=Benincasa hispida TaxID=102211 RepID=UPI0018FF7E69|nr:cation/H(+) antiporter 3-like [Benincasa hispida]